MTEEWRTRWRRLPWVVLFIGGIMLWVMAGLPDWWEWLDQQLYERNAPKHRAPAPCLDRPVLSVSNDTVPHPIEAQWWQSDCPAQGPVTHALFLAPWAGRRPVPDAWIYRTTGARVCGLYWIGRLQVVLEVTGTPPTGVEHRPQLPTRVLYHDPQWVDNVQLTVRTVADSPRCGLGTITPHPL